MERQTELMHEWAVTFIRFMAGEKVHTPSLERATGPTGPTERDGARQTTQIDTNDPNAIDALFEELK